MATGYSASIHFIKINHRMSSEGSGCCSHWLPRKGRNCAGRLIPGTKFCGNHLPSSLSSRVPCPLDPTHTVLQSELESHMKKCSSVKRVKTMESQPFYWRAINSESDFFVTGNSEIGHKEILPSKRELILGLSETDFVEFIQKIENAVKVVQENRFEVNVSKFVPERYETPTKKEKREIPFSEKHAAQQASVIGNMAEFELLGGQNEDPIFVEFGAGRGYLSQSISDYVVGEKKRFVLVDRRGFKFKADRSLRKSDEVQIERIKIDIADLDASKIPMLQNQNFVGISKHLCGPATDLTLRCCYGAHKMRSAAESNGPNGVAIATCCHHLCSWKSYLNQKFFLGLGFSPEEFEMLTWLTSWAVSGPEGHKSGIAGSDPTEQETDSMSQEKLFGGKEEPPLVTESHQTVEELLPVVQGTKTVPEWHKLLNSGKKVELGLSCKALIDIGRLNWLQERGYQSKIVEYVPSEISPENKLLLGRFTGGKNSERKRKDVT